MRYILMMTGEKKYEFSFVYFKTRPKHEEIKPDRPSVLIDRQGAQIIDVWK